MDKKTPLTCAVCAFTELKTKQLKELFNFLVLPRFYAQTQVLRVQINSDDYSTT